MIFAQAVAEYGAIASMTAAAQRALYSAEDWVSNQGASTWMFAGAVLLLCLVFTRFRGSRQ
jgi:hypothetical protein